MMEYKVGDEILIKAVITGSREDESKLLVRTTRNSFLVEKNDVIPAPDMTAEEAWKIAKKILLHPANGGFNSTELEEIFGRTEHLWELTPQEAKKKIEAWEASKEIKVGDFVELENKIFCVTSLVGEYCCGMDANGYVYSARKKYTKKTGRHIDIDGLMNHIRGDD